MLYKKITIPVTLNNLHVEIQTTKEKVTCVFKDVYNVLNGEISLAVSARELFIMTKNKNPFVQRVWKTKEGTLLDEKSIISFGDTYYTKEQKDFLVKKNLITGYIR